MSRASSVCRQAVGLTLSFALAFVPQLSLALPAGGAQGTATAKAEAGLEGILATLEDALDLIPRERFDPVALAATLGTDPAAHLRWVRDQTHWVAYEGALRGPRGVLADRVGNSLDRALLLAEMLESIGLDVRLRRATLDDTTAEQLLESMRRGGSSPPPVATQSPEFAAGALEIARAHGVDVAALDARFTAEDRAARALQAELDGRVESQTAFLMELVSPYRRESEARSQARLAAARDHWWVQARVERDWLDLDPTLPDATVGEAAFVGGRTVSYRKRDGVVRLPRGVAHEVELRVVVEQSRAGRLREREALSHVLQPYALGGRPVSLAIAASHAGADADATGSIEAEIRQRAEQPGEWVFALRVGEEVVPGRAMLADGGVATPDMSPGRNRQRLGGALDRLGVLERAVGETNADDRADTFASAAWLEFEIRVPGREPETVRRPLFDLLGESRRDDSRSTTIAPAQRLEREAALMQGTDLVVLGARLHPDIVADRLMRRMVAMRAPIRALLADPTAEGLAAVAGRVQAPALPLELFALASQRHQAGSEVYIDAPNVLAYERGYRFAADGDLRAYFGLDIVANGVGADAPDRFAAAVRQGVVDTNLEVLLLGSAAVGDDAATRLAESADPAADWQLVTEAEQLPRPDDEASARARALMADALAAGHAVVVPREASGTSAWWRVDLSTGRTLGMAVGGGQAQAEQGILLRVTVGIVKHWRLLPCLFPAMVGLAGTTAGCVMIGLTGTYSALPAGRASIPWAVAASGLDFLLIVMNGHGLL